MRYEMSVYLSFLASHVFFLALLRSSFQSAVCISHDGASLALILPYLAYILFHCLWFFATLSWQFWYLVYVATSGGVAYLFFHFFYCVPLIFCFHGIWLHCAMLRDCISAMKPLTFLVLEKASVPCSSDSTAGKLNT